MQNTNTNTQYTKRDWDNQEAGVIWKRKTKAGQEMLTGKVTVNGELFEFVCFTNKNKYNKDNGELIPGKDTQPDFRIYPSEKRDNTGNSTPAAPRPTTNTAPAPARKQYSKPAPAPVGASDDDII
jgi:hypothetical protein